MSLRSFWRLTIVLVVLSSAVPGLAVGRTSAAASVAPWAASGQIPKTTLTVCVFSGPTLDTLRRLSPQFTASTHGTVNVRFVEVPDNTDSDGHLDPVTLTIIHLRHC